MHPDWRWLRTCIEIAVDPRSSPAEQSLLATFFRKELAADKVERQTRIHNMAASLIEMFGDAALQVAHGQSADRDVGGNCGIVWHELADAIGPMLASELQRLISPIETREAPRSQAVGPNTFTKTSINRPMGVRYNPDMRSSGCFGSYVI